MLLNGATLRAFVPIMVVVSLPHIIFFLFTLRTIIPLGFSTG
jgi:hypothetical protein